MPDFRQTCLALGVSRPTLRRWLQQGAPQLRPGAPGLPAVLDVEAIRAWRAMQTRRHVASDVLTAIAGRVPVLVAGAVDEAFKAAEGPHKRALGDPLALAWYLVVVRLTDEMRIHGAHVNEIREAPASIQRLRDVSRI